MRCDVSLGRDVGRDGKGLAALVGDALDGLLRRGVVEIGDRDLRALARAQDAHGAAIADRIGGGVEHALAAADDQDAAALQPSPARRFAQ